MWNNWVIQITGGITWNNWIFKFHQVLNRVQKIPWLIYIIEILGENDVITRKMTGKSTKWEKIKASPYNYSFSFGLKRCLMSNLHGNADTKEKNKFCHHPWSVLVSTVALDQSAPKNRSIIVELKLDTCLLFNEGNRFLCYELFKIRNMSYLSEYFNFPWTVLSKTLWTTTTTTIIIFPWFKFH